ncbi:MAG: Ldh family oxidoreductase [Lachnospiraceae bacterium]
MSLRIPYDTVKATTKKALMQAGLSEEQAEICSTIHSQSSADGVESHGLNRITRFVEYIQKGWVDPQGTPELKGGKGAVENYDGHLGIGITNALYCADRAMELAKIHGIGCVTLKNTTHWMRGGTYAWRMAEAGFMGISWISKAVCRCGEAMTGVKQSIR